MPLQGPKPAREPCYQIRASSLSGCDFIEYGTELTLPFRFTGVRFRGAAVTDHACLPAQNQRFQRKINSRMAAAEIMPPSAKK